MTLTNRHDLERLGKHHRNMWRIRAFEEAAEAASKSGQVTGAVHLSIGQEGIASGVMANLRRDDMITSNHRGHGHTIAKGADVKAMMAELFGREGGSCGGKGGSMHIADFGVGMLGANGVVAAGLPIAAGAAHAVKLKGGDQVVVCFFGDGAANRGPFLEALNWAKIYDLPVLFVCEDNQFAATTRTATLTAGPGPSARAEALGIPAHGVDGNDVLQVDDLVGDLVRKIRSGAGPQFLHARTYRIKGHTAADAAGYRDAREVEAKKLDCPIGRCAALLREGGVDAVALAADEKAARDEIAAAVAFAAAQPWPDNREAYLDIQDVGAPSWS